jgi:hypothetical protein
MMQLRISAPDVLNTAATAGEAFTRAYRDRRFGSIFTMGRTSSTGSRANGSVAIFNHNLNHLDDRKKVSGGSRENMPGWVVVTADGWREAAVSQILSI